MEDLVYEAAILSAIQLITNYFEIIQCSIILMVALFELVIVRSIVYYLYLRFYIPGPKGTFFLGNTEEINNELINYEDSKHQFWKKSNELYKGIYRIVIGHQVYVILRDVRRIEILLRNSTPKAGCIMDKLYPFLGQGILTHQRLDWKASRKLLYPLFTTRAIQGHMRAFNVSAERLMDVWSRLPDKEIVPLGNYMDRYTMEVLINCIFHRKRRVQETPDMAVLIYIRKLAAIHGALIARQYNPAHHFDTIYHRSAKGKQFLTDMRDANRFLSALIMESVLYKQGELCTSAIKKGRNIMEILMRYKDKKGEKLSRTEIFDQINNLLFCAFQPTSISLQYILYCLGLNDSYQESCRHEVLTVMCGRRDIEWSDTTKFRFLTMCIYESLRLFAPTGSLCRQMDKSTHLDGLWVPPGTKLLTNVWHLHEDTKLWPNPHRFNPLRFKNEEEVRKSYSYLPFSDGPRKCLGHQFAIAEMKVLLAYILMNYRIMIPRDYQMDRVNRFFLAPRQDIRVLLKKM